jgi:hypothetical protein
LLGCWSKVVAAGTVCDLLSGVVDRVDGQRGVSCRLPVEICEILSFSPKIYSDRRNTHERVERTEEIHSVQFVDMPEGSPIPNGR